MDGWSWVLLAAAAYLAVTALARLMKNRYDGLVAHFRRRWQEEQDRRSAEERRQWREEREKRLREQINKPRGDAPDKAA
jgi:hypothetical protein